MISIISIMIRCIISIIISISISIIITISSSSSRRRHAEAVALPQGARQGTNLYEELTRLAETRLAQHSLRLFKID